MIIRLPGGLTYDGECNTALEVKTCLDMNRRNLVYSYSTGNNLYTNSTGLVLHPGCLSIVSSGGPWARSTIIHL